MKFFGGPNPFFTHGLSGKVGAQLFSFDVYYVQQLVAGFIAFSTELAYPPIAFAASQPFPANFACPVGFIPSVVEEGPPPPAGFTGVEG